MAFAYIAGPLFDEGERWFVERLDAIARDAGFETFLPHRDNPPKTSDNVDVIYRNDRDAIDRCDLVVANLNGITTDDGTAWELGYAFALGKPCIGYFSDWRARFPNENEHVNLMIECSLEHFVHTEDELRQVLAQIHTDSAT